LSDSSPALTDDLAADKTAVGRDVGVRGNEGTGNASFANEYLGGIGEDESVLVIVGRAQNVEVGKLAVFGTGDLHNHFMIIREINKVDAVIPVDLLASELENGSGIFEFHFLGI
jgi:hypothetical protein